MPIRTRLAFLSAVSASALAPAGQWQPAAARSLSGLHRMAQLGGVRPGLRPGLGALRARVCIGDTESPGCFPDSCALASNRAGVQCPRPPSSVPFQSVPVRSGPVRLWIVGNNEFEFSVC